MSKFLDQYELSKLLRWKYDMHGASLVITPRDKGINSEIWAGQHLSMYIKWAEKLGLNGRVLEEVSSRNRGIKSATIEFEFQYAYGYLMGEKGVHYMINSLQGDTTKEAGLAAVDVVPLFLETVSDIPLDDNDLIISYNSSSESEQGSSVPVVLVQHVPTGISVQCSTRGVSSSGERHSTAEAWREETYEKYFQDIQRISYSQDELEEVRDEWSQYIFECT